MKTKTFLKNNKEYFIASAIILTLLFILYGVMGVFPFGGKSIAHYDLLAQITPLTELIFDFLEGKAPLFYTIKTGMGANIFEYLTFFMLSPFSFLMLLGGRGNVIFAVNFVFIIKLIFIAAIAVWFIKRYFKKLNSLTIISFALLYAFCGYSFMMYTWLPFMDYLIYMPLLFHCFCNLKNKGKIVGLGVVIWLMILSCFSLGAFHLILLLIIFSFYVFICVPQKDQKTIILKTFCSVLIGVGLAMPLILPNFKLYLETSRNLGFNLIEQDLFGGIYDRLLTIIVELILVLFSILYLIKCNKKDRNNKFIFVLCFIIFILVVSTETMSMLNGGSVFGYLHRFGAVSAFLTLFLACKYVNELEINLNEQKKYVIENYVIFAVMGTIYLLLSSIIFYSLSVTFSNSQTEIMSFMLYVGISIFILLPIINAVINRNKIGRHFFVTIIIATLLCCGSNLVCFVSQGITEIKHITNNIGINRYIEDTSNVKLSETITYYSQPIYEVNAIDTFSSSAHKNLIKSLGALGYGTTTNTVRSFTGTLLSDMMVNNKYFLSKTQVNKWYLKFVNNFGENYLYENLLCSNSVIKITEIKNLTEDLLENQQLIFEALGGTGNILEKVNPEIILENCEFDALKNCYVQTQFNKPAKLKFNIPLETYENLYLYFNKTEDNEFYINKDLNLSYKNYFYELNKETNNFELYFYKSMNILDFEFYKLNTNKLKNLTNKTDAVLEYDYNKIKTTIKIENNEEILVIPYINLEGYSLKINGEKAEFDSSFNNFLTKKLKSGQYNIEIEFINPAIKYLLLGVIATFIFILLAYFVNKFVNKFTNKLIVVSFLVVSVILFGVFIYYPSAITMIKILGIIK